MSEQALASQQKGKTKKMKGIPYSELVAMREKRRIERREEHKDRPKTQYKGLTWHTTKSGKGSWHVQVWTGKTVSLPLLLPFSNLYQWELPYSALPL